MKRLLTNICICLIALSMQAQTEDTSVGEVAIGYFDVVGEDSYQKDTPSFSEDIIREYNHAVNLNTQKDYIKAFEAFHSTLSHVEKIISNEFLTAKNMNDQDFYFYMRLLNSAGQCAFALGQYTLEQKYLETQTNWLSDRLDWENENTHEMQIQLANYFESYASLYMLHNEDSISLDYHKKALGFASGQEAGNAEMQIRKNLAQLYYKDKMYDAAEANLDTIINYYNRPTDNLNDREQYYITIADKAMCQARMGEFYKANKALDDILENLPQGTKCYQEICRRKAKVIMLSQPYLPSKDVDIKEAAQIYRSHFDWIRNDVKSKFAWLTESQREEYWMNASRFVTDSYCLEDNAADLLYDVTLYRKAILLQLGTGFEDLLTVIERDSLDNMRVNDIFSNADAETLPSARYERKLMSRIMHDGRLDRFFSPLNYTWKDVRSAMPKKGCAIEFVQYEHEGRSFMGAIVVSKNCSKPRFIPLFDIDNLLGTKIEEGFTVKDAIDSSDPQKGKNSIYTSSLIAKTIWTEPLRKAIGNAERVYFSPDGFLHQLGIEYMLPEDIADKRMYRLTSTRLLADKSKWVNRKKLQNGSALVCGNINYDEADDDNVPISKLLGNDPIGYNIASYYGLLTNNSLFAKEVEDVITARDNPFDVELADKYATEYAFQNSIGNHSIIHLCTHGCFASRPNNYTDLTAAASSSQLSYSFLGFAGCNANTRNSLFDSRLKDGILSARELSKMHMSNVELFTTSACQTNMGLITADGLYGIVRGLKSSGVKSVVTSLWSVYSDYSRQFMPLFHSYIRKGMDIYSAFHTARKDVESGKVENYFQNTYPNVQDVFILIDALETEE